jgi:hypothetical protein
MKGFIALLVVAVVVGGGVVDRAAGNRPSREAAVEPLAENVSDADATGQYLAFVDTALTGIENNAGSIEAAIGRAVSYAGRECPALVAGAAIGQSRWPVEMGITEDLGIAADHANAAIIFQLLRGSERLRSRDPALAGLLRDRVGAAARLAELARPRICMVLHGWREDHFQQVPRKLADFSRKFDELAKSADLVPSVLRRYIDRRDIASFHDVRRREEAVEHEMGTRILVGRAYLFLAIGLRRPRPARHGVRPSAK